MVVPCFFVFIKNGGLYIVSLRVPFLEAEFLFCSVVWLFYL